MTITSGVTGFSNEQHELWDLWSLSQTRDRKEIESALHADYVGTGKHVRSLFSSLEINDIQLMKLCLSCY